MTIPSKVTNTPSHSNLDTGVPNTNVKKKKIEKEKQDAIVAENERIKREKEAADAWEAGAPERERLKEQQDQQDAIEKKNREEKEDLLRQRIMQGEPATKGNVLMGDRVKRNGQEATVVGEWYEIKYVNNNTEVVKLNELMNMTAVERTLKQEATNQSRRNIGGTRRKRKNKNRKTKTR